MFRSVRIIAGFLALVSLLALAACAPATAPTSAPATQSTPSQLPTSGPTTAPVETEVPTSAAAAAPTVVVTSTPEAMGTSAATSEATTAATAAATTAAGSMGTPAATTEAAATAPSTPGEASTPSQVATPAPTSTTVLTITGTEFKFSPNQITVKVGQPVTIVYKDGGSVDHELEVDSMPASNVSLDLSQSGKIPEDEQDEAMGDAAGNQVHEYAAAGGTAVVTFTPTQAGTYNFACNLPGHKEAGMTGTIVVQP